MDKRIAWTAWGIYSLIICAGIARGGVWLDEMQVWCLARDSNGLIDLFDPLRNEGHPPFGHFAPAMIGSEEHHLYLVQLKE